MDRKEFLSALGLSSGALIVTSCLAACAKNTTNSNVTAPIVDFTLDLSSPANAALNNPGGYVYSGGVIVAKTTAGNIIAVSQACTHQGVDVIYNSNNQFYCPSHGAAFSTTGAVINGPANTALKEYKVTVTGNKVNVTG